VSEVRWTSGAGHARDGTHRSNIGLKSLKLALLQLSAVSCEKAVARRARVEPLRELFCCFLHNQDTRTVARDLIESLLPRLSHNLAVNGEEGFTQRSGVISWTRGRVEFRRCERVRCTTTN
jgi:hypothetical protein